MIARTVPAAAAAMGEDHDTRCAGWQFTVPLQSPPACGNNNG